MHVIHWCFLNLIFRRQSSCLAVFHYVTSKLQLVWHPGRGNISAAVTLRFANIVKYTKFCKSCIVILPSPDFTKAYIVSRFWRFSNNINFEKIDSYRQRNHLVVVKYVKIRRNPHKVNSVYVKLQHRYTKRPSFTLRKSAGSVGFVLEGEWDWMGYDIGLNCDCPW